VFLSNKPADYQVIEAPIQDLKFSAPLFHQPSFIYRQGQTSISSFAFLQSSTGLVEASVSFALQDKHAVSLPAAPFGSFYAQTRYSKEKAYHFVEEVKKLLKAKGCDRITVKHYPACYGNINHDFFFQAMKAHGFEVLCQEINQYLSITQEAYTSGLHESERRRLKKCHQQGFAAGYSNAFDAVVWFDRIVRARTYKGHPLSIDLENLKKINQVNPERYHFFTVKDGDQTIASAIAVEVLPDVLYYYLPADEEAYQQYSPMVMLIEAMYHFAQEKKMRVLDLGISSSEGLVNEGLRVFKKHLGAEEECKYTLTCLL
jgi:hypothetical protein